MPTAAELAAQLHPPRLPADFAALTWQDCTAAFGAGLLAALLVYLALRPLLHRREDGRARIARELRAIGGLPTEERLFRQAAIRARLSGAPPPEAGWRAALYRPGATVDHAALDAEILALAARAKV